MAYAQGKCRICGRKATAKRPVSKRGKCRECGVKAAADAARVTFDTAQAVREMLVEGDPRSLDAGLQRMASYMRQRVVKPL